MSKPDTTVKIRIFEDENLLFCIPDRPWRSGGLGTSVEVPRKILDRWDKAKEDWQTSQNEMALVLQEQTI